MPKQLFTNNASSTLATGITSASNSLTVATGDGAKFPSPTGGDFFFVTLAIRTNGVETTREIVKVTARTMDSFTIVRAQEGTMASAFSTGDVVALRLTAGAVTDVAVNSVETINLIASGKATLTGVGNQISVSGTGSTYSVNPATAGSVNNVSIGQTTAAAGSFTTLNASGTANLSGTGNQIAISGAGSAFTASPSATGSLNNVTIGGTTAAAATFTTLTATGAATLNGTGNKITVSGAGSTFSISPATAGTINNVAIGGTTAAAGSFTTLASTGATSLGSTTATSLNNTPIGATTASTGSFTTLAASGAATLTGTGNQIAVSGAGSTLSVSPATTGSVNNVNIGATTAGTGSFTTLASTGATTLGAVTATSLNNTPIGATTANSGSFTTLASSGATTLGSTTASAINSTPIGATTASTGSFTTLASTGTTTLGSTTATALNNTPIGGTTANSGAFTTLSATGAATLNGTGNKITVSGAGSTLSVSPATAGSVDNVNIGATSQGTGRFSTLESTGLVNFAEFSFKGQVRAATTANITLSAPQTIDGVAVVAGDRVLVKNQTDSAENGIYVVNAASWTRALDANTSAKIAGAQVTIREGTVNGGMMYASLFKSTDTLGTTAMPWYQEAVQGVAASFTNLTATGQSVLTGTGNQIAVSGTGSTLSVNPATVGSINNVNIGATTAGTLRGTTVTATTQFSGSGAGLTNIPNTATTATSANTANAIVTRDASGNFSAGTITAALSGNATSATTATTATNQSGGTVSATSITGNTISVSGSSSLAGRAVSDAIGANTIVTRDGNGYSNFNYIHSNTGNSENPSVSQVIVTNGGDGFFRKASIGHLTASLSGTAPINITGSAASASSATFLNNSNFIQRTGSSGNLNTDFANTPAGTVRHGGDDSSLTNNPGGAWWFHDHYRHSNSSNTWGVQVSWGWEDNAHRLATRNISAGNFSGWVYYLNSVNFNSFSPTLTGGGASGTWGINITGNAATASNGGVTSVNGRTGAVSVSENIVTATGGAAPYYGARAWVFFNGNNQVINSSANVTSVVEVAGAGGSYNVNFQTPPPTANYVILGCGSDDDVGNVALVGQDIARQQVASAAYLIFVNNLNSGRCRSEEAYFAAFW